MVVARPDPDVTVVHHAGPDQARPGSAAMTAARTSAAMPTTSPAMPTTTAMKRAAGVTAGTS